MEQFITGVLRLLTGQALTQPFMSLLNKIKSDSLDSSFSFY